MRVITHDLAEVLAVIGIIMYVALVSVFAMGLSAALFYVMHYG